jgi:UDP-N-acetylglucosamine acyltransferase
MSSQQAKETKAVQIHRTAEVHPAAVLGEGVSVGPQTIIGPNVRVGAGTVIHGQAFLDGHTTIGENCQIFPFASVGSPPQDLKYKGEPTELIIGDRNLIRECTTINTGTVQGGGVTRIGDDNLIMAYAHVAHDCHIGNHCVLSNNAALAGHVTLEDWVVIAGGWIAVHQFVRLGSHCFLGAGVLVGKDVPPFVKLVGNGRESYMFGLNTIGLERRGFTQDAIQNLKKAYRRAFRSGLGQEEAVAALRSEFPDSAEVQQLADFIASSERGVSLDSQRRRRQRFED